MPDGTQPHSAIPNDPASSCGPGDAPARPLAERQVEALGELVEIGLKIARAIERRVDEAGAGPEAVAELNAAAIAFARVARAVRQTIMLQSRLREDQDARTARAGDLRVRVSRIVRRAIDDEHDDLERAERLAAEAAEGLEQERYGDLLTRPVGEIVAAICKDLGLAPDWPSLDDDIAAAEAFARGAADAPAPARIGADRSTSDGWTTTTTSLAATVPDPARPPPVSGSERGGVSGADGGGMTHRC